MSRACPQTDAADRLLSAATDRKIVSPFIDAERMLSLMRKGDKTQSRLLYKKLHGLLPKEDEISLAMAEFSNFNAQWDSALIHIEAVVEKSWSVRKAAAEAHIGKKDLSSARLLLERMLVDDENCAWAWYLLAVVNAVAFDGDQARLCFVHAVEAGFTDFAAAGHFEEFRSVIAGIAKAA